jgi:hypothetical protein
MPPADEDEVDSLRARLTELEAERSSLIERLERLRGGQSLGDEPPAPCVSITLESSAAEKIALFRRLFSGRTDVSLFVGRTAIPASPGTLQRVRMNGYAASVANRR